MRAVVVGVSISDFGQARTELDESVVQVFRGRLGLSQAFGWRSKETGARPWSSSRSKRWTRLHDRSVRRLAPLAARSWPVGHGGWTPRGARHEHGPALPRTATPHGLAVDAPAAVPRLAATRALLTHL
jgi:hypothetical protein